MTRQPDEPDAIDKALDGRDLPRQYRGFVRALVAHCGIGAAGTKGEPDRVYVAELAAYYLGRGPHPITPRSLSTLHLERWAKRRVWDELEQRADRLPALVLEREPIANADELNRRLAGRRLA